MLNLVPAGPPAAAILLAALFALAVLSARLAILARRGKKLDRLFHALAPLARDALVNNPKSMNAQGSAQTITYLSCRLPDAALLEPGHRGEPARFVRVLEGILESLTQAVLATGGTIERYGANGFCACWNAPLADSHHAAHACAAGADMLSAIQQHNRFPLHDMKSDAPPLSIAMGIASGPAITGVFGKRWSVAGETVARAEHLRDLCGAWGFSAIVDAATQANVSQGFALLDLGEPDSGLFALLGDQGVRAGPKFRALSTFHERIFAAMAARAFADARELIAQARKLSGASSKFYDQLTARIAQSETVNATKQNVA